jgi:hypothetical protein
MASSGEGPPRSQARGLLVSDAQKAGKIRHGDADSNCGAAGHSGMDGKEVDRWPELGRGFRFSQA